MNEITHIAIYAQAEEQLCLEKVAPEASLDSGHWRLPVRAAEHGLRPPAEVFCGLNAVAAQTVSSWLEECGITISDVVRCSQAADQSSPAWHPQPQRLLVIKLLLKKIPHSQTIAMEQQWRTTQIWLQRWRAGVLLLNPMSLGVIEAFSGDMSLNWEQTQSEQAIHGVEVLPIRSHTLPPANHTNAFLIGAPANKPTSYWLVDPSPADSKSRDDLLKRIGERRIEGIFLTHHHPDHHQQSVGLAQHWQVPIRCSHDTAVRIPTRFGKHYWRDVELQPIADGEALCSWNDRVVRVHAVPGHDAGQLALMPENRCWMIVGDLIQGIGTVVIAKPEGNMRDYFRSMQWVIDQAPAAIIPSHGQAMGGTYRIEQTLQHRKLREQQVLQLHQKGLDLEQMVANIYASVDRRLWGLAKMSIECHLDKLAEDDLL